MKKSESIERAVEFIRKRGSARTPEIAAHLGIAVIRVSSMLWPAVHGGRLVSCKVDQPGKPPCNEYRIGAGQPQVGMTPMQTYRSRGADAKRRAAAPTVHKTAADVPQTAAAAHKTEGSAHKTPPPARLVDVNMIHARARWALASDGTFVQLPYDRTAVQVGDAAPIVIPAAAARDLVEFIRRLDGGEV